MKIFKYIKQERHSLFSQKEMNEKCYNPIIVTDLKLDLKGRKKNQYERVRVKSGDINNINVYFTKSLF